jgi:uncharacterized protein with GYD domain
MALRRVLGRPVEDLAVRRGISWVVLRPVRSWLGVLRPRIQLRPSGRKSSQMPYYMVQAAYSTEAWSGLVKNPQNRLEAVRPVVEKLGGKIEGGWLAFGEYDVVLICEMPNNISATAFSMAASAGGAVKAVKTTPLMTIDEGMEAMRKASGVGYRPPSS